MAGLYCVSRNLTFCFRCFASELAQPLVHNNSKSLHSGAFGHIAEQLQWLAKPFAADTRNTCPPSQWAAFFHARQCQRTCLQRAADVESRIVTIAGSFTFTAPGQVTCHPATIIFSRQAAVLLVFSRRLKIAVELTLACLFSDYWKQAREHLSYLPCLAANSVWIQHASYCCRHSLVLIKHESAAMALLPVTAKH